MNSDQQETLFFSTLLQNNSLLKALEESGYEAPTPIQEQMIPHLLAKKDVIGQAQTGTGKTAAFALPLLENMDLKGSGLPQVLIIAPTRELAMQVSEAFAQYGKHLSNLKLVTVFGGQDYNIQLKQLKRKPQVVVGTPGRLMDHVRRGTIKLDNIKTLVLDEADEMLNMGFIDDVEWVLERLPKQRQIALFSATMPSSIRKIAQKYLQDPVEISIKNKTATASTISQRYMVVSGYIRKQEALQKVLDSEDADGVLIFVRTKLQTVEIAEKLVALGHLASPLNGDIPQNQRIRAVEQLKKGQINILVATDVAARGLDVKRVSHVINFDIPFDVESYIHRIGRTGRAGRTGEAILFVNPRERRMLKSISKVTKSDIKEMRLPTEEEIEKKRASSFTTKVKDLLENPPHPNHSKYCDFMKEICLDTTIDPIDLMAVLTQLATAPKGLFPVRQKASKPRQNASEKRERNRKGDKSSQGRPSRRPVSLPAEEGMERFRIEVGYKNNVKPGNIVGAIANEADISSEFIGRISISEEFSHVDLPYGMPKEILRELQRARVNGVMMKIKKVLPDSPSAKAKNDGSKHSKSLKFKNKGNVNFANKRKPKAKKETKE